MTIPFKYNWNYSFRLLKRTSQINPEQELFYVKSHNSIMFELIPAYLTHKFENHETVFVNDPYSNSNYDRTLDMTWVITQYGGSLSVVARYSASSTNYVLRLLDAPPSST